MFLELGARVFWGLADREPRRLPGSPGRRMLLFSGGFTLLYSLSCMRLCGHRLLPLADTCLKNRWVQALIFLSTLILAWLLSPEVAHA